MGLRSLPNGGELHVAEGVPIGTRAGLAIELAGDGRAVGLDEVQQHLIPTVLRQGALDRPFEFVGWRGAKQSRLEVGAILDVESGLLQEPRIDARFASNLPKLLK